MGEGDAPFGHSGLENRYDLIRRRVTGAKTYAENIALSKLDSLSSASDNAVEQWLENDEFKKNIEGEYTHISIAVYRNDDTNSNYFTLLVAFIK